MKALLVILILGAASPAFAWSKLAGLACSAGAGDNRDDVSISCAGASACTIKIGFGDGEEGATFKVTGPVAGDAFTLEAFDTEAQLWHGTSACDGTTCSLDTTESIFGAEHWILSLIAPKVLRIIKLDKAFGTHARDFSCD